MLITITSHEDGTCIVEHIHDDKMSTQTMPQRESLAYVANLIESVRDEHITLVRIRVD